MGHLGRMGLLALAALFAAGGAFASADEVWVAEGGSDDAAGTEAEPFATIAHALTECNAGGTVRVKAGTYEITSEILVAQDVKIVGADRDATTVKQKASGRVFQLNHANAVVKGLTITGGSGDHGAGVYINSGTLSGCHVTKNVGGAKHGGGVYLTGSSSVVTNCLIDWNTTSGWGSGTAGACVCSRALLVDCDVMWNKQATNNGCDAGGVAISGGSTIRGCRVMHNLESGKWSYFNCVGGVMARGTGGTIDSCLIAENYGHSSKMPGAGLTAYLDNNSQNLIVVNSTIVSNESDLSGAGVYGYQGKVYLTNCVIQANTAFKEPENAEYKLDSGSLSFDHCVSPVSLPGTDNVVATLTFTNTATYFPAYHPAAVYAGWKKFSTDSLAASFTLDKACVMTNDTVTATAIATPGKDGGALSYRWDFGDGTGWSESSSSVTASHVYKTAGKYTVTLEASAVGVDKPVTYTQVVRASPLVAHVVNPSTHKDQVPVYPYLTEDTAATNIQDAVDAVADGATVIVHPGTYSVMGEVKISKGITLESSDGRDATIIQSGLPVTKPSTWFFSRYLRRAIVVDHPSAVVRGFTMRDGSCLDDSNSPATCGTAAQIGTSGGTICGCTVTASSCGKSGGGSLALYSAQAVVSNCTVSGNSAGEYGAPCGGVFMSAGFLTHSVLANTECGKDNVTAGGLLMYGGFAQYLTITNNYSSTTGGGVYLGSSSAILANSLVANNSLSGNGGGVCVSDGKLLNCTIVGNKTTGGKGGGVYASTSARIYGCLITGNTSSSSDDGAGKPEWYGGDKNTYLYSCASVAFPDESVGCASGTVSFEAGTYKPLVGQPCYDLMSASVYTDLGLPFDAATTRDYYSQFRLSGSKIDAGCAEYQKAAYEATVTLQARVAVGKTATFTVNDGGATDVEYAWRVDDGDWSDYSATASTMTTNFTAAGNHSVSARVRAMSGGTLYGPFDCKFVIAPPVAYVVEPDRAALDDHVAVSPYESWETAATNAADALAVACDGTAVVVSDGVYRVRSQIEVTSGIRFYSVNGAAATTFRNLTVPAAGVANRVLFVNHPDAWIDGFTLTEGRYTSEGGKDENTFGLGVLVGSNGGTVVNCIMTGNGESSGTWGDGFAVLGARGVVSNCVVCGNVSGGYVNVCGVGGYVKAGLVTHCLISNNVNSGRVDSGAMSFAKQGAGLKVVGGRVTHCTFVNNWFSGDGCVGQYFGGGAIYLSGGIVDNCLVVSNTCRTAYGGGIKADGGTLLNCTICGNVAGTGGGLYVVDKSSVTVRNCIIQDNTASTSGTEISGSPTATYSLAPSGLPDGEGNIVGRAAFRAGWQHRQRRFSPGVDTGSAVGYEEYLTGTDLFGRPRVSGNRVDMGADECRQSGFVTFVP